MPTKASRSNRILLVAAFIEGTMLSVGVVDALVSHFSANCPLSTAVQDGLDCIPYSLLSLGLTGPISRLTKSTDLSLPI
jgi:hypothetical protein